MDLKRPAQSTTVVTPSNKTTRSARRLQPPAADLHATESGSRSMICAIAMPTPRQHSRRLERRANDGKPILIALRWASRDGFEAAP